MNYIDIDLNIIRLKIILDGWKKGDKMSPLDKDIALDILRKIYEEILFSENSTSQIGVEKEPTDVEENIIIEEQEPPKEENIETISLQQEQEVLPETDCEDNIAEVEVAKEQAEPIVEQQNQVVEQEEQQPQTPIEQKPTIIEEKPLIEVEDLPIFAKEDEPIAEQEVSAENIDIEPEPQKPNQYTIVSDKPIENVVEQPKEESEEQQSVTIADSKPFATEQLLFGEAEIPSRPRKRSVILSLYEDNPITPITDKYAESERPTPMVKIEEEANVEPVVDPIPQKEQVEQETEPTEQEEPIVEQASEPQDQAEIEQQPTIEDLEQLIDSNARRVFIAQLFGGDETNYDRAIANLDLLPTIDDCLIYIAEHYCWRSGTQAVQDFVRILEKKYNV